ncbi:hypothetical protein KIW84_072217 [Lathyrus oleraceus]|uniref:Uncharacterized protein n=1 Tax=Pisum sativum TaxID=3888 RepID=A0A9D4VKN9_PEA|nr:hypothetical protein KIW84_072217 [Pisum sativum]
MRVPSETSGSSLPTSRANTPFQIINLVDLVFDVSPLSMVHPPSQKKATPSVSKNFKTSGSDLRNPSMHVDGSEKAMELERSATDKELGKFVASLLKEVNSDVFPDVQTSLAKDPSPDNVSSRKFEESVPEHATRERRSKKKLEVVFNVEELTSDEEPLTKIATPSIAKRLQKHKGKTVVFEDSSSRELKRKVDRLKVTPSRSSIEKSPVGPTRSWSKGVTPTRKREVVSSRAPGPSTSKKSVIGQLKETCKELEDSIRSRTATKIKLETLMKDMMEEEKKEVVKSGDVNEGTDDEDYAGEYDAYEEKEDEGEEYATTNSDSQEDI